MIQNTPLAQKLDEIADFLFNHHINSDHIGVLGGSSGAILFHFYYSKYSEDEKHADKGSDIISQIYNNIQNGYSSPTFCQGIAGFLWTLELLIEEELIDLEEDIIPEELDIYLFKVMKQDFDKGNYDFLHGAIGYGIYFLKRFENTTDPKTKKRYRDYLLELISFLDTNKKTSKNGIWWASELYLEKQETIMVCNLGLAHGIPSITNFLTRLLPYTEFKPLVVPMIKNSIRYIRSCKKKPNDQGTTSFPSWFFSENQIEYRSRLAWCYGDLGIAITLLNAGNTLKDNTLINEAVTILKHSTKRKDPKEAMVLDAGLCHGAFGVSHLYTYAYQITQEIEFRNTAIYWANIGLDMSIHKDGYAGYQKITGENMWSSADDLLDGIAGIGLAILSNIASFPMKWDTSLLIR